MLKCAAFSMIPLFRYLEVRNDTRPSNDFIALCDQAADTGGFSGLDLSVYVFRLDFYGNIAVDLFKIRDSTREGNRLINYIAHVKKAVFLTNNLDFGSNTSASWRPHVFQNTDKANITLLKCMQCYFYLFFFFFWEAGPERDRKFGGKKLCSNRNHMSVHVFQLNLRD